MPDNAPENHFDVERIRKLSSAREVVYLAQVDSTNSHVLNLLTEQTPCPLLIIAERQTAGRGQQARRWYSSSGSLTFSICFDADEIAIPRTLIPVSVGVCVCEVLNRELSSAAATIKWPNDILIDQRKVGGILVETVGLNHIVTGIGLNINNSVSDLAADSPTLFPPCALIEHTRSPVSLTSLVISLGNRVCNSLLTDSTSSALQAFERLSLLRDHFVEIELPNGSRLSGIYCGIATCGSLLLAKEDQPDNPMKFASAQIRRIAVRKIDEQQ